MKRSWLLMSLLFALASLTAASMSSLARAKDVDRGPKSGPVASASGATARASNVGSRAQPRASTTRASTAADGVRTPAGAERTNDLRAKPKATRPCYARPIQLVRVRGSNVEPYELSLTMCNGTPNRAVLDTLSVLARPRDGERPTDAELRAYRALPAATAKARRGSKKKYRDPQFVSEHVMRLHAGLLVRLQRIANRYRGKAIEVVSGYRPEARESSRHHQGRALDLRVVGVPRERLRDFLRRFDQTGVGYYPNSFFVHMDVRDIKGYWIDRSGPGEPADYGPWPPPRKQIQRARERMVKGALADLAELQSTSGPNADTRTAMAQPASKPLARH